MSGIARVPCAAGSGCLGRLTVIPVGSLLALVLATAPHNRIQLQLAVDTVHNTVQYKHN